MIGQLVGNYKIEAKLGEGGMGAVYKGVDTMLDREVAIKALRPELASQTSVVERFRSEAVTLAKLNHPNIAALYTMFRQGEELYMVLEFVRGETLDTIIQKRGAMPAGEAIPVFCQVLDGINHAHELGVVHRDIKPANIMLTENGKLKVLDFGIARLLGSARMTRAGNIIGTLEYMAPEQVKGQETDGRSDIYALGMMLYEVLTGRLPFETENEFELMKLQTEAMPPNPRSINPAIPEEVDAAIMRAVQKNPDERFQTAGEMRDHLLEAGFAAQGTMHGITGTHARPQTHPSRPPVSQSDAVSDKTMPLPVSNAPVEAKSTRLGTPATVPVPDMNQEMPQSEIATVALSAENMKATRLGAGAATAGAAASVTANTAKATRLGSAQSFDARQSDVANAAAGSFFSNLKPVHYIGAGVGALVLLGLLILIPALFLIGGGSGAKAEDVKPAAESPKVPEAEKPSIVEMPKPPPPVENQTTMPSPESPSVSTNNFGDLKTGDQSSEDKTAADKPAASKPADKPNTVAQKPDTPKPPKQKADSPPPAPKPKGKSRAEELLTGN